MKIQTCPKCEGKKWLYEPKEDDEDDVIAVPCVCLQRELFRDYLIKGSRGSRDIASAKHVKSPLFTTDRDASQENLLLRCSWDVACQHLKWVLAAKYRQMFNTFTFRVVDDDLMLSVWLGKKSYRARASRVREDVETFNDLSDLLEGPSLVVVRLGIAQRNSAIGDVLGLALGIRDRVSKPTWVVEDLNPYIEGNPAYAKNAAKFMEDYYTLTELEDENDLQQRREEHNEEGQSLEDMGIDIDADMPHPSSFESVQTSQPQPKPKVKQYSNRKKPEPKDESDGWFDGDDSPLSGGSGSKKKKKGRWK